jgi:hypothetical protein
VSDSPPSTSQVRSAAANRWRCTSSFDGDAGRLWGARSDARLAHNRSRQQTVPLDCLEELAGGAIQHVDPPLLPNRWKANQIFQPRPVKQAVQRPLVRGMGNHEDAAVIAAGLEAVQEARSCSDDLSLAPATWKGQVNMTASQAGEIASRAAVQVAVVALSETLVLMDGS